MHIKRYIITLAESPADAGLAVGAWIGECYDREFFDYAGIVNTPIVLVKDILAELADYRRYSMSTFYIKSIEEARMKGEQKGEQKKEGYMQGDYGNILRGALCEGMPYYNLETNDWTVPSASPKEGFDWYAVFVDFHC